MSSQNERITAVILLLSVLKDRQSLSNVLPRLNAQKSKQKSALVQELVYGVLRYYHRFEKILSVLLDKPIKSKDKDIEIAILIGLYQLDYMRVPAHAAVATAVDIGKELNKKWSTGFINAILRAYQLRKLDLENILRTSEIYQYSHPSWLIKKIAADWSENYKSILLANNQKAAQWLRINTSKICKIDYIKMLELKNIEFTDSLYHDAALRLESPVSIEILPGYKEGLVSVQDGASQLVVQQLELSDDLSVLDACAAPGGKTAQILQSEVALNYLLALDKSNRRLETLEANLKRLDIRNPESTRVEIKCQNAKFFASPDNEFQFDRILLDAPCSATGVIRKHPDIKHLRRLDDIENLLAEQRSLLSALWAQLKPGGILIYSTCSILKQENELQIDDFVRTQSDAHDYPIEASWGQECEFGRQILPGENSMDGFYIARLRRQE